MTTGENPAGWHEIQMNEQAGTVTLRAMQPDETVQGASLIERLFSRWEWEYLGAAGQQALIDKLTQRRSQRMSPELYALIKADFERHIADCECQYRKAITHVEAEMDRRYPEGYPGLASSIVARWEYLYEARQAFAAWEQEQAPKD